MKKFVISILLFFLLLIPINVLADEKMNVYFFYGDGCPHCAEAERELLPELEKMDDINLIKNEVWFNEKNQNLLNDVASAYDAQALIPFIVVGDAYTIGYSSSTKETILNAIRYYRVNEFTDQVAKIQKGENITLNPAINELIEHQEKIINVPLIGEVNVSKLSVGFAAVVIGLVDGFNPCAMWILVFLLTTLIYLKDKKRMVLLGLVFILTSGITYFLIMFGWLNIVIKVSASVIMRYIIAVFALGAGMYNLYSFYKSLKDDGCTVVSKEKRKTIFARIKKYTYDKRLIIAIFGIMALAVSVNIVELLCSAGLPIVFSELLAINNIHGIGAVWYDLIYLLFFMLDDLIVFFIAVKTMNIVGISNKFNKYSQLIGGLIMIIIGLLLIFNPGILMLNF